MEAHEGAAGSCMVLAGRCASRSPAQPPPARAAAPGPPHQPALATTCRDAPELVREDGFNCIYTQPTCKGHRTKYRSEIAAARPRARVWAGAAAGCGGGPRAPGPVPRAPLSHSLACARCRGAWRVGRQLPSSAPQEGPSNVRPRRRRRVAAQLPPSSPPRWAPGLQKRALHRHQHPSLVPSQRLAHLRKHSCPSLLPQ